MLSSSCISLFWDKPVGDNIAPVKAKRRRRPPVVMTKTEVCQVLNRIKGAYLPMAKVMYGEGFPGGEESPGTPVIKSHTKVQTSLSSNHG